MSLLNKFETAAEYLFTNMFKKTSSSIQPVEVAGKLLKAMLRNKQVSISHVYVPNIYRVQLNKEDYKIMENFGETFLLELAQHLYTEAGKQGYTFLTLPLVELYANQKIGRGEIEIETEYNDSIEVNWEKQAIEEMIVQDELERTTIMPNDRRLTNAIINENSRKSAGGLEIIKGNEEGRIYCLEQDIVTVGRQGDCDVEIKDEEMSRKHFRLYQESSRWFIQDLGSTNGTYVNKLKVDKYMLHPGDKIRAGQTVMVFKRK
ncbi:FHA domain containing protein [Syntrophobotulus glycolicus DSM 8271]|uniref:FHA domain containing protein n=1 Tax=Syntrophobotulus glycolicus (strain DSM 8271 / FlGlyR) TaxID=645991 RepID=F0SUR1_SYNGF|nr:DUF3662 and FHA domain-containing protein [Syntrophobotulus glycolicus]ADY56627.1 FHA domain containing protein [Syntrophobotulus glycolicus DSM 8271]